MNKRITISSMDLYEDLTPFDGVLSSLPRTDPIFELDEIKATFERLKISVDGISCGICLYKVADVGGRQIFFIGALAIDAQTVGGEIGQEVYNWLILEAKKLGCEWFVFDSVRRGMLDYARKNDWSVVNIRYAKRL